MYRNIDCPNCGRHRVSTKGICDKCFWDVDGGDYVTVTRPDKWRNTGTGISRYDKEAEAKHDAEWGKVFEETQKEQDEQS